MKYSPSLTTDELSQLKAEFAVATVSEGRFSAATRLSKGDQDLQLYIFSNFTDQDPEFRSLQAAAKHAAKVVYTARSLEDIEHLCWNRLEDPYTTNKDFIMLVELYLGITNIKKLPDNNTDTPASMQIGVQQNFNMEELNKLSPVELGKKYAQIMACNTSKDAT